MTRQPRRPQRALGQPTRGKTAHNRLRRVDVFVILYDPGLIRRRDGEYGRAPFVDLGYGAEPWTTLESAARFRRLNPTLPVVGVEIDPERVAAAQPFAGPLTEFRLGGFNLPVAGGVRLIRAFNVLRQYDESEVAGAWSTLGDYLLPGGLLIEGTSDPTGGVWVANLLRKRASGLAAEGLLFGTNFRLGFEPALFQPVLPKNYIHRVVPGEPILAFFAAWKRAHQRALPVQNLGLRQLFAASARYLADQGYTVETRRRFLSRGFLLLKSPLFQKSCEVAL